MQELESFGSWLKRRRRSLDLTQAELARRVGCSAAAIRKIESDERKPSQQLAELLARELDINEAEKKTFIKFARNIFPASEAPLTFTTTRSTDSIRIAPPSNNLPTLLTSLIDRKRDIAAVLALIASDSVRWITLVGSPGIGKTRLSIQCGQESLPHFRDGVWFVDLSAIQDASFVLPAIGRAIGLVNLSQAPGLDQLIASLNEKSLLLVLDNFEQVEEAAVEVSTLLKSCPKIKVLVTSRNVLKIYGEHEYHVPPLSVPPQEAGKSPETLMQYEAVELFVMRARQYQTAFEINPGNAAAIVEICNHLDGIPLALELAAASLHRMSLDELASIFHRKNGTSWLGYIGRPFRDLPPRQQTLENIIAWSYRLLSPERQDFFRRLGVFSHLFDAEAAAYIAGENTMASNLARSELDNLTDNSLLQRFQPGGHPYWHMLEIIHEFASLQLSQGERAGIEAIHAAYYSSLLESASSKASGFNGESFFQLNAGNLHQALRWFISSGETVHAFSLAINLCEFWERMGYLREGLDLMQQVLAIPGESQSHLRFEALFLASVLAWQQHRFELAISLADKAADLGKFNQVNNKDAALLNHMGRIYIEQGRYVEASQVLSECLNLCQTKPEIFNPGRPMTQLGEIALAMGNYPEAQSVLEEALGYLTMEDDIFLAMCLTDLAEVALFMRKYLEARNRLRQAMEPASHHIRRSLYYLTTLAGYFVVNPESNLKSFQHAVQIYGALETLKENSGEEMVPYFADLNTRRIESTRRRLSKNEWQIAWDTGRHWKKDTQLAQASKKLFEHFNKSA